jgi:ATP-dependent DNA helicase RecQ
MYGLDKASSFASASTAALFDIKDEIDRALSDGLLALTPNVYPTVCITAEGRKLCEKKTPVFRINNTKYKDNPESNKIYEKIKILREEIASREGIVSRAVISDKAMRKMSQFLPKNRQELSQIPGIGPIFVSKFGDIFIQVIHDKIATEPKSVKEAPKPRLSDESVIIMDILAKGSSLDKISETTGFALPVIARILEEAIGAGARVDRSWIVTADVFDEVKNILLKKPKAPLRSVRYDLKKDIDYPLLRIIVALARQEISRLNRSVMF